MRGIFISSGMVISQCGFTCDWKHWFPGENMKIMLLLKNSLWNISKAFVRFPLTCALLLAVLVLTLMDVDVMIPQYLHESVALGVGILLSLAVSLAIEGTKGKVWILVASYAGVILLSAGYYAIIQAGPFALIESTRLGVILSILLLAALVIPVLRHKANFNEVFLSFFKGFFTTAFFVGIAYGGVMSILGAVDNLLFRLPEKTYLYVSLTVWIFCASIVFLSLIPRFGREEETERNQRLCSMPGFLRIVLTYVVIPLAYVYTLVLILYIIRTLVAGEAQTLLYPMSLTYFSTVLMIYLLSGTLENKLIRISRFLFPKLMLVIALYTSIQLFLEIPKVGVTNTTYYAILITVYSFIVGVVTIFLPIKRNEMLAMLLSGLLLVSIVPPVDAFTLSTRLQTSIAEEVLVRNGMRDGDKIIRNQNLSEEDKAKLRTAMAYLDEIDAPQLIRGVPEYFSYYSDFNMMFGADVSLEYNAGSDEVDSFSYQMNQREPVSLPDGGYLFVFGWTGGTSSDNERSIGVVDYDGKTYTLYLLTGPDRYDIELRSGTTGILTVSAYDAYQSLVDAGVAPGTYSQVDPQYMRYMVENDEASMHVVFSSMDGYIAEDRKSMNTSVTVIVYFED